MADVMRSSEITPELVLVDPELAELARAMLGEPGELPPHARPPAPVPEPVVTPARVDGRPPVVAPALLLVAPARVEAPEPVAEPEPVPAPEPEPVPVLATVEPEAAPAAPTPPPRVGACRCSSPRSSRRASR